MTARIGAPKTGGRRKGSLDKGERQVVTAEMAADLLAVYQRLGGVKWLLKFAQDNPKDFLQQGLSRLFPAAAKDDPDVVNNTINVNGMSEIEAATRVAFALSKAIYPDPSLTPVRTVERLPTPEQEYINPNQWTPPVDAPDMPDPVDEERARWIEELPLTPQERLDNAAIRETREADITNYHGSGAEQGYGPVQRQSAERDPRAAQRDRMLAARRQKLL